MPETADNELINAIAANVDAPVAREVSVLTDQLRPIYGDTLVAVIAYGSCLRDTGFHESLVDLYAIVDRYRDAHQSRLEGAANRLIPPNVYYLECADDGQTLRTKYAVVTLDQFENRVGARSSNPYFWARFSQPCALVFSRDSESRTRIHTALATAARTAYANGLGLTSGQSDWRQLWTSLFQATYRTELRPESASRAASIVEAGAQHFERISGIMAKAPPAPLNASWLWRRIAGKALSVARLIKAGFTFRGGADYMAWKISRHSGVTVEVTPWHRRHPILGAILMAPKLYRKGGIR